jgi:hypothetical protein
MRNWVKQFGARGKRKLSSVVNLGKINVRPLVQPVVDGKVTTHSALAEVARSVHRTVHQNNWGRYSGIGEAYFCNLVEAIAQTWHQDDDDVTDGYAQQLLDATSSLSAYDLPPGRWLSIYDACFATGLLGALPLLRERALKSAFIEAHKHPKRKAALRAAFSAAIEQSQFDEARKFLEQLERIVENREDLQKLRLYYLITSGQRDEANDLARKVTAHQLNADRFRDLVQGKTIAVVGPAPDGQSTSDEIDSHDLVVRINYRGRDRMPDPIEFGSRIDISYYNGQDSRHLADTGQTSFFSELRFAAFKSIRHEFQTFLEYNGVARQLFPPVNLFNGTPLQGQNLIYDLLHFNPARIKLFKSNLFMDHRPYDPNYRDYQRNALGVIHGKLSNERLGSFATHDLLSQRALLRTLIANGLIYTDKTLTEVLNLGDEDYLNAIKRIYT